MSDNEIELAETIAPAAAEPPTQLLGATVATSVPSEEPDDARWRPGDVILDEYEVERMLGAGGMGRVYLVRNQLSGQRFAVKSTNVDDPDTRQRFLRELRTWLELPEHPNLTACRFYRTVEGRVVIFAEYVPGGSLAEWLKAKRIESVEQVIDLAIQIARGLRVAHDRDLIHRDIKPGNVLLSNDGVAKVTDFGLAGASDVTIAGLTPQYCSPEQAFRDQPVRYGSDVWSWAVTVLEMFTGEVVWPNGAMVGVHLTQIVEGDTAITIPEEIEALLGACFSPSTDDRPQFDAVISRLEAIYAALTDESYERADVGLVETTGARQVRSTKTSWSSPRAWFDETEQPDRSREATTSRVAAVSDLGLFERALQQREERLAQEDTPKLRDEIAHLLIDKAKIHRHGGDFPGALASLDQARDLVPDGYYDSLATVLTVEGIVLIELSRYAEAVESLREALDLRQTLRGFTNDLEIAEIRRQIARGSFFRRKFETSVEEARRVLEQLDELEPRDDEETIAARRVRALTLFTLATAQSKLDTETARRSLQEAVDLGEELVVLDGCHDFREDLAKAYFNLAVCQRKLDEVQEAIRLYGRVCRLQEQLVATEGRDDLIDDLAMTHSNLSFAHRFAEQLEEAERHADRAIGLRERLVHLKGRRDLRDRLAASYVARAYVAAEAERWNEAVEYGRLAASLREHLVYSEGREDLERRLAGLCGTMGTWRESEGRPEAAIPFYERAIQIREARQVRRAEIRLEMLIESHLRLAQCCDDPEKAEAARARALELLDENPDVELTDEAQELLEGS